MRAYANSTVEPVIGIDVTEDGKYILSTCKTYILVINTETNGDDGKISGFQKSLGAKKVGDMLRASAIFVGDNHTAAASPCSPRRSACNSNQNTWPG